MINDHQLSKRLTGAGLRPTAQRLGLARLLFAGPDRHVSAEALLAESEKAGHKISLATVYNTLHQFKAAGLLRELAVEGARTYYDTNTSDHFHFYNEENGGLTDINPVGLKLTGLPELPKGHVIDKIDVIVRLRKV